MKDLLIKQNQYLYSYYPELFLAINYHRTHNNQRITFENYRYMKQVYCDKSDYIVIEKSTQAGLTEWLVVNAIYKSKIGRSVFYVLPTFALVSRFVKNRIERTLEYTDYYKRLLQNRQSNFSESISLKHIGHGAIAFIGSNASAGFTEFPADDLIIDELDECDATNLPMAEERLSASKHKKMIKIGNPTITDFGIDHEYNKSDMKVWRIKCEHCGEWINPDFFQHVVKEVENKQFIIIDKEYEKDTNRDINLICDKCNKPVNRFGYGEWVVNNKSDISGYRVSKLFSTNTNIVELVNRFDEGLKDDTILQRFYNGDLGLPYTSTGSKITIEMLNECKRDYSMPNSSKASCIMGIDIGGKLNVVIRELLDEGKTRLVYANKIENHADILDDIQDLHRQYNVKIGCIDADPEINLAKNICRLKGMFRIHFKEIKKDVIDPKNKIISVDRTSTCDALRSAIISQLWLLPMGIDKMIPIAKNGLSEYYYEMTNSVRIFQEDKQKYKWVEGSNPDHYMFAENLCLIAKRIITKLM